MDYRTTPCEPNRRYAADDDDDLVELETDEPGCIFDSPDTTDGETGFNEGDQTAAADAEYKRIRAAARQGDEEAQAIVEAYGDHERPFYAYDRDGIVDSTGKPGVGQPTSYVDTETGELVSVVDAATTTNQTIADLNVDGRARYPETHDWICWLAIVAPQLTQIEVGRIVGLSDRQVRTVQASLDSCWPALSEAMIGARVSVDELINVIADENHPKRQALKEMLWPDRDYREPFKVPRQDRLWRNEQQFTATFSAIDPTHLTHHYVRCEIDPRYPIDVVPWDVMPVVDAASLATAKRTTYRLTDSSAIDVKELLEAGHPPKRAYAMAEWEADDE